MALSPNINLSTSMVSEAISEHLILKFLSRGACPQTPLACVCLHTHHNQCPPPNLKHLAPPLEALRIYEQSGEREDRDASNAVAGISNLTAIVSHSRSTNSQPRVTYPSSVGFRDVFSICSSICCIICSSTLLKLQ